MIGPNLKARGFISSCDQSPHGVILRRQIVVSALVVNQIESLSSSIHLLRNDNSAILSETFIAFAIPAESANKELRRASRRE